MSGFHRIPLKPIDTDSVRIHDRRVIEYFEFYGIRCRSVEHFFGTFESPPFALAAHVFKPKKAASTVFLLHGYFDHTGILKNLIRYCLDLGHAVVSFDLPGHGLSTGKRSSIDDFGEYAAALGNLIGLCAGRMPEPYASISHSTGGAAVMEYLAGPDGGSLLRKNIFLAPLVRSGSWKLSRAAFALTGKFIKSIPRGKPAGSSDTAFLEFLKNDPLQNRSIPIEWLKAMYEWNRRIEQKEKLPSNVLVIQGADDKVVDWKFNIPFLKKIFADPRVKMIENGRHHLINEDIRIRTAVFSAIGNFLSG